MFLGRFNPEGNANKQNAIQIVDPRILPETLVIEQLAERVGGLWYFCGAILVAVLVAVGF